jgi:hypothetical protein
MILLLAVLILAGILTWVGVSVGDKTYVPLAIERASALRGMGLMTTPILPDQPPVATLPQISQSQKRGWIQETLCYPHTPVHSIPDKFLNGLKTNKVGSGKLKESPINDVRLQAVYRDILSISVRRVDIWADYHLSPCEDGEWVGSGTAFAWTTIRSKSKVNTTVWLTADHIPFLHEYDQDIGRVKHLRIDGSVDVVPLARLPHYRLAVLLASELANELPMDGLKLGDDESRDKSLIAADEDWHVGDFVYVPFFTLALQCIPQTYEELYRKCVKEVMIVDRGIIASAAPLQGEIGGEITITSNLVPGSSGSPYMLYRPNGDEGTNGQDFQILAVENAGFGSGIAVGQRFTRDDARKIRQALQEFKEWKD